MYTNSIRRDPVRRLRRLIGRQVVLLDRAVVPRRRPRSKPMPGDLLRRMKRLEAALHIRDKRKRPRVRKARRIAIEDWTIADIQQLERETIGPRER